MMHTVNKLALTPYNGVRKLESTGENRGFATVKQKTKLVPLELVVDALIVTDRSEMTLKKGSKVYFKEETLATQQWSRQVYEIDGKSEKFVLAEWGPFVVMVEND